jgi:alpha-tubulin suppressor-like RCC1 family protein
MNTKRNLIKMCLLVAVLLQALTSGAQPVTKVAGGFGHSLFLKSDGSLWAMGDNFGGDLGEGTYNETNRPAQIVTNDVIAIAAGGHYSLFLKSDGSLWAMGVNGTGNLGDGTYNQTNRPELIVTNGVTAIAAGEGGHSLFLKNDGSLWAMGENQYGELGDSTYNNTNRPEEIVASNVTAIAIGLYYSLFLKNDGSLWAMDDNSSGEFGDGTSGYGVETNRPELILTNGVTAIAAGDSHSLFLKSDGSLWGMGDNQAGELGDGTFSTYPTFGTNQPEQIVASNVMAIAAGGMHSLFLKSDGSLWAMGWDYNGELGDGANNNTDRPEQIVTSGVTAIAAGRLHSLFLKSDGSLWAMGENGAGQLGDGNFNNTNLPVQIVAGSTGYNQISAQLLSGDNVSLSYVGIAGTNYELDHSFSLSPANWVPQLTNPAGAGGVLVFTNTPNTATNNFWRIHSVP